MDQSKDPKHLRTEKHVWIQAHQSEWFYIPVQLYILYATLLCLSCTESNVQSLTDVWVLDKIILRVLLGKGGKASICWKQFRPLEYQQLIKFSSQTNPPLLLISQYIASTNLLVPLPLKKWTPYIMLFTFLQPFDRSYIDNPGPMVVFATPGMLHAGLSLQIFKKWAEDEKNMVHSVISVDFWLLL